MKNPTTEEYIEEYTQLAVELVTGTLQIRFNMGEEDSINELEIERIVDTCCKFIRLNLITGGGIDVDEIFEASVEYWSNLTITQNNT